MLIGIYARVTQAWRWLTALLVDRYLWVVTLGRWQMLGSVVEDHHEIILALVGQRESDWESIGRIEWRISEFMRVIERDLGVVIPAHIEGVRETAGGSEEQLQEALLGLRGLHAEEEKARAEAGLYEVADAPPNPTTVERPPFGEQ